MNLKGQPVFQTVYTSIAILCFVNFNWPTHEAITYAAATIVVVTQPLSLAVEVGASVHFDCAFSSPVSFVWFRRDQPVEISGRYRLAYVDSANCSLLIEPVEEIDFGVWRCGSAGSSSDDPVYTEHFQLTKKVADLQVIVQPSNVTTVLGNPVTLECRFSRETVCTWTRRNHKVVINKRYSYVNDVSASGGKSADCSIAIAKVEQIDLANWQCVSEGTSAAESVESHPVWIIPITSAPAKMQVIEIEDSHTQSIECVSTSGDDSTLMWEFRASETDRWSSYSGDQAIDVGAQSGFYRCSVLVQGKQSEFLYYQIVVRPTVIAVENARTIYISVIIVIVVFLLIFAVGAIFLKKKYGLRLTNWTEKRREEHKPLHLNAGEFPKASTSSEIQPLNNS